MTIKEEIKLRAESLADFAIAHGAPWKVYNKGYIEGAENAYEITVDRAVKWLKDHLYVKKDEYGPSARFVRQFIEAMRYDTD